MDGFVLRCSHFSLSLLFLNKFPCMFNHLQDPASGSKNLSGRCCLIYVCWPLEHVDTPHPWLHWLVLSILHASALDLVAPVGAFAYPPEHGLLQHSWLWRFLPPLGWEAVGRLQLSSCRWRPQPTLVLGGGRRRDLPADTWSTLSVAVATRGVLTDAWPSCTLYVSPVGRLVISSFFIALAVLCVESSGSLF